MTPEQRSVPDRIREADDAASVAHDFIHGLHGVTREQADEAIWKIHEVLRPLIDSGDGHA